MYRERNTNVILKTACKTHTGKERSEEDFETTKLYLFLVNFHLNVAAEKQSLKGSSMLL